jgi:integrase
MLATTSGEHVPLLVDSRTGLPLNRPNQYMLAVRRDRCQVSTMMKEQSVLCIVLAWAHHIGIDLHGLLDAGKGLDRAQLAGLIDMLRRDFGAIAKTTVVPFRRPLVAAATWAHRIVVAREYFAWNLERVVRASETGSVRYQHVDENRKTLARRMTQMLPRAHTISNRKGLDEEQRQPLLDIIAPTSLENPFHGAARDRNALIVEILMTLGLRRGELLKLRTSDVRGGLHPALVVERRPDDPDDPRMRQPQVKTRGRQIPLDEALARHLSAYILNVRRLVPNARKTPFLFLARSGKPLSLRGLDNVFAQIVVRKPEFDGVLTPHVLRHTANDLLSESFERAQCKSDEGKAVRNYLMGWEPESEQGLRYSRAHVERIAQRLSLDHQRRLFGREDPS